MSAATTSTTASAPAPAPTPDPSAPQQEKKTLNLDWSNLGGLTIAYIVLIFLFWLLYGVGAAKLSYDHFQSVLWAIVAFLFAPLYYPFYAFMYSTPAQPSMFGGRKRGAKLLW